MKYKYIKELAPDQAGIVTDFMDSLSNNDKESFWNCLSRSDKGYIFGTYNTVKRLEQENLQFADWLDECYESTKAYFSKYIDNYGVSTSVRYNTELVGNVFLPLNIETNIVFMQETEALVMVLPLILETDLNEQGEIVADWKVYLFANEEIEAPF